MNKICILGHKGNIGNRLTQRLHETGKYFIRGVDIKNGPDDDLCNPSISVVDDIRQSDIILFLAFDIGGSQYLQNTGSDFFYNNMKIMNNTFPFCQDKTLIFFSSHYACNHASDYAALKRIGEEWTRQLTGINLRLWNVYGYEQHDPPKNHLIHDCIYQGLTKGVIQAKSLGLEKKQFLYIEDLCDIIINNILHLPHLNSLKYDHHIDITSGHTITVKKLVKMIASKLNVVAEFSPDHGNDFFYEPEPSARYPFEFKYTKLSDGLDRIINEYKRNITK